MDGSFTICGALIDVQPFETNANKKRRYLVGNHATSNSNGVHPPGAGGRRTREVRLGSAMKSVRPVLIALSLAVAMVLIASVTGDAAMLSSLSSDHARPGDWILLLTDDHNGTWDYHSLSAAGRQPIYLAPVGGDDAAACTGQSVGRLQWRGNRGGVAFRVPNRPPGVYQVFVDVVDNSPSCWVTNGLTIGNVAADNQAVAAGWTVASLSPPSQQPPGRESNGPWLPIVGALIALAVLSLFGLWKRQKRVDAKAIER